MIRRPPRSTRHTLSLHDALPIFSQLPDRSRHLGWLDRRAGLRRNPPGRCNRRWRPQRPEPSRGNHLRSELGHVRLVSIPDGDWKKRGAAPKGAAPFSCAIHAEESFDGVRSEEHTSELQSLMRISYAVFCLKKKKEYN